MNVLGNDYNKKKWFIIGGVILLLFTILLILFLNDNKKVNNNKSKDSVSKLIEDIQNGDSWYDRGDYVYRNDSNDKKESSKEAVPIVQYGGVFKEYNDYNTYAEIKVEIKEKGINAFRMYPSSVVFDAKKKEVVIPSMLKEFKGSVRVLSIDDMEKGLARAEVLILNDMPDILYSNVTDVVKSDKGVLLFDDKNKKAYVVSKNTRVKNALTKGIFDNDFKDGDRLFIFPKSNFRQEKVDIKNGETYGILDVKELYVYPSKNDK